MAYPPGDVPFGKSGGTCGGQSVLSLARVMKTRSPQTAGVELPGADSGTFQRTFSVGLHLSGRSFSADTPWLVGPRQPGQLSALAHALQRKSVSNATVGLMSVSRARR